MLGLLCKHGGFEFEAASAGVQPLKQVGKKMGAQAGLGVGSLQKILQPHNVTTGASVLRVWGDGCGGPAVPQQGLNTFSVRAGKDSTYKGRALMRSRDRPALHVPPQKTSMI